MSVETVRRLLELGLVPRSEVELALLQAVIRSVPFIQAFVMQRKDLSSLMERELSRSAAPAIRSVHALPEICSALPVGMCERLLAVPIRQESITRTVDVAAVDPYDSHIQQEFSFHLDAPVRILRAPLGEVLCALENLHAGGASAPRASETFGDAQRMVGDEDAESGSAARQQPAPRSVPPSHPPIPLVRRSAQVQAGGASATGVAVSEGSDQLQMDEEGQPVIGLWRAKVEAPDATTRSRLQEADLAQVERQLTASKHPDEVLDLLKEHACPEGRAMVFGVKSREFVVRSASFDARGLGELSIQRSQVSVFRTALDVGHYLGSLPATAVHARLRDLLAYRTDAEVYVTVVLVSQRPTLLVLVAGFERSFTATRRADRLATAAGAALERLLIERKKSREPIR